MGDVFLHGSAPKDWTRMRNDDSSVLNLVLNRFVVMTSLPNELLLLLFAEFHLTTLVVARGVCRKWRTLLEFAKIHPARKSLLEIYLQIITEPWFLDGRPWVLDNLVPFDREAYVDAILSQHHYNPEDFRIWLLEWPAKAVIGGIWPGLPELIHDQIGRIGKGRPGWNLMNWAKPLVCTVKHINDDPDVGGDDDRELVEPLPGLPIFHEEGTDGIWMLLDPGRYRDQVLFTFDVDEFMASYGPDQWVIRWPNWIEYVKDYELGGLRRTYSSLSQTHYDVSPPEKNRMHLVAWSAEQKPYWRKPSWLSVDW